MIVNKLRPIFYGLGVGCITLPLALIILFFGWQYWRHCLTYYVPEINMHVRIERSSKSQDSKVYFSRDGKFGRDYIEYERKGDLVYMHVYFVPPNTICVSGADGVKQGDFNIIEFEEIKKFDSTWSVYTEYTDSTFLKNPSYCFYWYDYLSGFELHDPNDSIVFKAIYGE